MKFQFELLEPPAKDGDNKKKAHEKLKELCLMMVEEAASRELLLACDIDKERWLGRNESIFH